MSSSAPQPTFFPSPYAQDASSSTAPSKSKLILKAMEGFAPIKLAEKWDNVGLIVDPIFERPNANTVLLCIDLTEPVVQEIASKPHIASVIAYHPPLFAPLKSLTLSDERQYVALACSSLGVSVLSPHTSLDNMAGGVNDWLAEGLDGVQTTILADLNTPLSADLNRGLEEKGAKERVGSGRIVTLGKGVTVGNVVEKAKKRLSLEKVRICLPTGVGLETVVTKVAICAGSGNSVLKQDSLADVWWTGEMSHHDILAALYKRKILILCEHSNTERGFLKVYKEKMENGLKAAGLKSEVSEADREPVIIVSIFPPQRRACKNTPIIPTARPNHHPSPPTQREGRFNSPRQILRPTRHQRQEAAGARVLDATAEIGRLVAAGNVGLGAPVLAAREDAEERGGDDVVVSRDEGSAVDADVGSVGKDDGDLSGGSK
ncbi:hypothetical protein HDU97_009317 [Phlyctochytrium planicorne]|nr:hypothetical protein HDU97_009317 [Phlyctochytrium planicorne]